MVLAAASGMLGVAVSCTGCMVAATVRSAAGDASLLVLTICNKASKSSPGAVIAPVKRVALSGQGQHMVHSQVQDRGLPTKGKRTESVAMASSLVSAARCVVGADICSVLA